MTIWYILCSFGTFSGFGIKYHEKSGTPETWRSNEEEEIDRGSFC
jgi:hypothetical protein